MAKRKSGYPHTLDYFMWPWQVHFLISIKVSAENLFNEIDKRFGPSAFLLGFRDELRKINEPGPPVCFEPENMDFLLPDLGRVLPLSIEIDKNDPERNMFYSGDGVQEEMDNRRQMRNYRRALEQVLNESPAFTDRIHFASDPVHIGGYYVYVILQLSNSVYKAYTFLHKNDLDDRMRVLFSLVEAMKEVYLQEMFRNLHLPDPGKSLGGERRSTEELIRSAGREFMYTIAKAGRNWEGLHMLYDALNTLSIQKYEGRENFGHAIVARKGHADIELVLEIEQEFRITEYRKVRKLLELTDGSTGLLTDSKMVFGLGRVKNSYNPAEESVFEVFFRGTHCYDVSHAATFLLQMRYGVPVPSRDMINRDLFLADINRIFPAIGRHQQLNLYLLADHLARRQKGAMMVIINDAAAEAKRLAAQCINIKPLQLDRALVASLTSIDGAIIVDLDGHAHAKGVILDGLVGRAGDSSRGSRYNSALTYTEYRGMGKPTMIVVVSEDGMTDVIPKLQPRILHSEITNLISVLAKLNSNETFDREAFYGTMNLLQTKSFYLLPEECKEINRLKKDLQELDKKLSDNTMWVQFEDVQANHDMNESYYDDEPENPLQTE